MNTEIIPFSSKYRCYLKSLNEAWLKKYFYVEASDVIQLGNPEKEIIEKGGFIYFAKVGTKVVGVSALMLLEDGVYELSKMAVDENYQGQGIGKKLAIVCIEKANEIFARKVILYSNRKLKRAIRLYEHLGFEEVDLVDQHYDRADIKMELDLHSKRHKALSFMTTHYWYR